MLDKNQRHACGTDSIGIRIETDSTKNCYPINDAYRLITIGELQPRRLGQFISKSSKL